MLLPAVAAECPVEVKFPVLLQAEFQVRPWVLLLMQPVAVVWAWAADEAA